MTPPATRTRAWLRRVALAAALLATVGALPLWTRSEDFQSRVRPLVEAILSEKTGEIATVERIEVQLYPPELRVQGLALLAPDRTPIAQVERVTAPITLAGGRPRLGRISLARPQLTLHLNADYHLVEFQHRPRTGRPLERLPWESLLLKEGELHLIFPEGSLSLTGLDILPQGGSAARMEGQLSGAWRGLSLEAPVEIAALQLGPDAVVIPKMTIDSDLFSISVQGTAPLTGPIALDLQARAGLDRFEPLFRDGHALGGAVDLDLRLDGELAAPEAHFSASLEDFFWEIQDEQSLKTYSLPSLVAAGTANRAGVEVARWGASWADGEIVGTASFLPNWSVQVTALGESLSLTRALQQAAVAPNPWVNAKVDAGVSLSGTLRPLALTGPFDLAAADFEVAAGPALDPRPTRPLRLPSLEARGQVTLTADAVGIQVARIATPKSHGKAQIQFGLGSKTTLDLRAQLAQVNLADFGPLGEAQLRGVGTLRGRVSGPMSALRFEGEGDFTGFSATGIPYADALHARILSPRLRTLELEDVVARVGSTPYTGRYAMVFGDPITMHTEVEIGEGRVEDVMGIFLDLPGVTGGLSGSLTLDGPFNHLNGKSKLRFSDVSLWGEPFEAGDAEGVMQDGVFTLHRMLLTKGAKGGILARGGVGRAWALNLEVIADGLHVESLQALQGTPFTGDLSLVARVDNTLFEPAPHGTLAVRDLRIGGEPLDDSVARFSTSDGVLSVDAELLNQRGKILGTLGLWGARPYDFRAIAADFPLHPLYPTAADGQPIRATGDATARVSGQLGEPALAPTLDAEVASMRVGWDRHHLQNARPWTFHLGDGHWTLTDFSIIGGETEFSMTASGGRDQDLALDGRGVADLDLLRAVVPGLSKSSGLAQLHLEASGRAPHVETLVDAEIYATLLRHDGFPAPLEDVRARVQGTRDRYTLHAAEAGLGGGTVRAWGSIDAQSWWPTRFDLQAEGVDTQVLWSSSLAPAIGDSKIRFQGPAQSPLLAGEITLSEMTFSDRIDWEDWVVEWRDELLVDYTSLDEEPLFSMDLRILADHTIRLRNNVADASASADLRVLGDTVRPGLSGDIWLHEGEVYLQDRTFDVVRGHMAFANPWAWDPNLDFDLTTEVLSRDQRYLVHYLVHGPFSGWTSETRSEPPLSQSDVNALLWFGLTTDELEEMGDLPTALTQGVLNLVLTDLVIGWTGDYREDVRFIVDRVDLVTGVDIRGEYSSDPRILVSKQMESLGQIEGTLEVNLVRPDDWYSVVERDLSDTWSLSLWYASRPRASTWMEGALGVDVHTRWERR